MNDAWLLAHRRLGVVVLIGTATVLAYGLSDLLRRLDTGSLTVLELASEQAAAMFLATVIGAAFGALLTVRYTRRAGLELWVTAGRDPRSLWPALFLATWWPLGLAWLCFLAVTGVRLSAPVPVDLLPVGQIWLVTLAATTVGPAMGILVGVLAHRLVAVPLAVVAAYVGTLVVIEAGDDQWWQWLAPGFGDSIGTPSWLWSLGQLAWYPALAGTLVSLAALVTSRPRAGTSGLALGLLGLGTGAVLLFLNGPRAGG